MKPILTFYAKADRKVFEQIAIRSGLCEVISEVKSAKIFIMKRSKHKCCVMKCENKAFFKVVAERFSEKLYSLYYCPECFFRIIEKYLNGLLENIRKDLVEYAGKEIIIDKI